MSLKDIDPKELVLESYRIEGITASECRSIFLDWALSLPVDYDNKSAIEKLLAHYGPDNPDHPMTEVLNQGLVTLTTPRRRGGWRSRER